MRLLVLRHGQAKDAPRGGDDIDRPLSKAGRAAAATLAHVVQRLEPQLVLCSSALRTRQTLEALELDGPNGVDVSIEPGLYGAEVDQILEHVRGIDDDNSTVLVVGHNPGVHQLVIELTGGDRVPSFRPATLAVVRIDAEHWWEVGTSTGWIESLHVPDGPSSVRRLR
ncbi:MAG TPA: histidine phosphatase family protein [Frankiaceae bacterium]|nr:histidine phosphatase family protein [Frankiaceae bacterium]